MTWRPSTPRCSSTPCSTRAEAADDFGSDIEPEVVSGVRCSCCGLTSAEGVAPVDADLLSGDERRAVAGQVGDQLRHILRGAHPAQWHRGLVAAGVGADV